MPATKPRAYQVYDIDWKQAVRALSDSNINLASPGALVIDAVVLDPYDRVLLTAQTNATQNGIYQVNAAQTLLVPAPDWVNINSGLSSAVNSGLTVAVTEGADYAQTTWTLTTPNPIVIGVTAIVFEQVPEASDRIGNIYFDGSIIELANSVPETDISILPSGAGSDVGIVIPTDATANVDDLHIFNLATNGNVKISTDGGDWRYDTAGNFTGNGNVQAGYFLGNGAFLTGISAGSSYSNANVANYLPTYAGNLGAGNVNFVNGSTIKTAVNNVNMNANTGGAVEITTDGGNYTWSYDNYGWMYLPQAQAAYTPVVNGSVLFGSEALVFKAGYANLIFDNTGNTTTANYFLGNIQGLVGNITNLDSLNFAVENISALVANNGVNIGAGGFNNLLVLPTDVLIQNVPLSVAANIVGVTANNDGRIEWMGNSSGDGGGYTTLTLTPDTTVNDQVLVLDPTAPGHIHLRAPGIGGNVEQPTANIFLGPENTNFEITAQYGNAPQARIHSGGYTWTFGNDGNLALPGNTSNINYANGISILDGYATISSQYLSNITSQSYNDFVTGNYYNASTLDIDYTAYTGASLLNFDIAYQAPLTANIGISVGAVNTPLIQANANIVLTANSGTPQTWTFGTDGNLTLPANMIVSGNVNFLGTDTALLNPADNTPLSLFTSGTNGTVTSFWAQDVGNLMSSNIAAFYLPLQGTQTVRIVNGTNGGNIAIYDFDKDGVFSTTEVSATGNVSADYLVVSGGIRATGASPAPSLSGFSSISTVSATGNITASGTLIANVGITTVGNVTGNYFIGNGSQLTGLSATYGNANVADYLPTYTGNIAGNIVKSGYTWTFSNTGTTTFPTGVTLSNARGPNTVNFLTGVDKSFQIETQTNVTSKLWNFTTDGNLTLPQNGNINFSNGVNILSNLAGTYGNANVANFLAAYGSNTIVTTGNITAGNLVGNISITGNVTGTSSNVTLVAGSYNWTFNNTGNLTLPGNTFSVNYANNTPVDVVTRFEGSWTVPVGNSTQSFTVNTNETYYMWVDCNIPNGILTWNATATVTNTNVPVVGAQYAWVYNGGGTPIDFTSIPNQFTGTANAIVRSNVAPSSTTNRFDFGINNTSGGNVTVRYGWVQIS